ncbi:MAG: HAD family phosphatase [Nitrospirae bacterium]|nr:HAD family phosphatase [Nitrospirota bacterium]
MIKAIIFDYGNIISSVDNSRFFKELSRASGKSGAGPDQLTGNSPDELRKYETGLITSDRFFERLVGQGGLDLGKEAFIALFTGRFTPIAETRKLIRKLKTGYKLGLLSNTNEWDYEYEIKQCDVFGLFDAVTVSFKVGAMKPDRRIYLDALNKLGTRADEAVYIDDISEYAEAACALGIRGFHYTSHEGLVRYLRSLNCLPDQL